MKRKKLGQKCVGVWAGGRGWGGRGCITSLSKSTNAKQNTTRMHSSRMRTARLLPVSPSMHCSGGGGTWSWGGWGDCTWSGGGGVPGPRGGVPNPRGGCTWSRGVPHGMGGGTCPGTPPCEQNH